jgi:hypothetical protein
VQVSELVVVVVLEAVVIDSRGSEARGSEQAVDHRVGRPVALGIGGLRRRGGVSRREWRCRAEM